jgi:hypothetical protein
VGPDLPPGLVVEKVFGTDWVFMKAFSYNASVHESLHDLMNLMIFINCTCMFTSANYQLIRSNCTDSNVHGNEKSVPSTPVEK